MFIVEVARICVKLFKAEDKVFCFTKFYSTSPEANSSRWKFNNWPFFIIISKLSFLNLFLFLYFSKTANLVYVQLLQYFYNKVIS